MIAPIVVLSTTVVFLSRRCAAPFVGPSARETWLPIHKVSFFVWLAFMAFHVLGHLPSMASVLRADYARRRDDYFERPGHDVAGRSGRVLALSSALALGGVLAILVVPEFGPWLHGIVLFRHHR